MDAFDAMSANVAAVEGEGDYIGPDDMLYCGVCGTRKTCRVVILGRERIVRCICDHEKGALELKRGKIADAAKAKRLRAAFPASAYELMTFGADDGTAPEAAKTAKEYAESFVASSPTGLLLYGKPGSGKTFLAACIANDLIARGYSVCFTSVSRVAQSVDASFQGRGEELARILRSDLLVVDDLGTERDTPYMMEHAFNLIDGRYKLRKPMVISTNIDVEQMESEADISKARIYGRIIETCAPVKVYGNRRRLKR